MKNFPRFCPNCGTPQTRTDARFCQSCGRPLPQRPAAPAGPPTPAPKPARRNRRRLAALLVVVLLLALAAVSAYAGMHFVFPKPAITEPTPTLPTGMPADGGSDAASPPAVGAPTASLPAVSAPVATATPPNTATPVATAPPPNTATPGATATSEPTATQVSSPTPSTPQATVLQAVNLRTGPGQGYDRIRLLPVGESLEVLARSQQGDWLQVVASDGVSGWASAQYLNTTGAIAQLPVVVPSALPPCSVAVDGNLLSVYSRSLLGCPVGGARITWSAWQPFERGAMLWRDDTNQVTVFYNGAGWTSLSDRWDQHSEAPSRGAPPAGLQAPIRGFGWIWGNRNEVFQGLGWAKDQEKGVCMLVQEFQRGFVITKSNVGTCTDRQGVSQPNNAGGLPPILTAAHSNGAGWQRN